jgi:hypothetical protein
MALRPPIVSVSVSATFEDADVIEIDPVATQRDETASVSVNISTERGAELLVENEGVVGSDAESSEDEESDGVSASSSN